tara:strand:- start:5027 stop:5533 length:507 start_codon:yes stop_codon:yes gene_type:complete
MKKKIKATYKRSIYKTFTWRVIASLDTAILAFLFSYYGNEILFFLSDIGLISMNFEVTETTVKESVTDGLLIGSIEIITKLIIYYFHERAWRIGWNKQSDSFHHSKKRSLYKAITYRIIGSLDTFIISTFIIKSAKLGGGVAIAEIITKPILYYIHERIWDKQSIGNK